MYICIPLSHLQMIDFRIILGQDVKNPESITMVGEDFIILDHPALSPYERFPYVSEWLIATLCENGSASGTVNLRNYQVEKGGFIIILPGQIIARSELSRDFQGKILLMSRFFTDSLDIGRTLTLTSRIVNMPYYQFPADAIDIVRAYFTSCNAMIRNHSDDDTIREVLRLLSRAFFLGTSQMLTGRDGVPPVGPYSKLTEEFLTAVESNYKTSRQVSYYARLLGKSEKYLSRHIKEDTGRNASDWIDKCVIMDAEAQLQSRQKSIREISESLGFPSQSFFGKYFKRVAGMSPKDYKEGKRV